MKALRWLAGAALVTAALGLATHGSAWQLPDRLNPFARLRIDETPGWLTGFKLRRTEGDGDECRAVLATSGLQFAVLPDKEVAGCELRDVVRISSLAQVNVGAPFMLSCRAALSLALWERHSLLPVSQRLLGATPRRIEHFGSFACRNVYGREGGRRSQHASADALDVAGFVFSDGRRITVARNWDSVGSEARFLRAVHADACRFFDAAFSPEYNAAHADHLHLDRGPFRACR